MEKTSLEQNQHKIYCFLHKIDFLLAFACLFPSINFPLDLTSRKISRKERTKMYRPKNQQVHSSGKNKDLKLPWVLIFCIQSEPKPSDLLLLLLSGILYSHKTIFNKCHAFIQINITEFLIIIYCTAYIIDANKTLRTLKWLNIPYSNYFII